jgi:hypothetical protein
MRKIYTFLVLSIIILGCSSGKQEIEEQNSQNCSIDYVLSTTGIDCDKTGFTDGVYTEVRDGGLRLITCNAKPDHDYWVKPEREDATVAGVDHSLKMDYSPSLSVVNTSILSETNTPKFFFGVALNGVIIAPGPGVPFIFLDQTTGEYNLDWVFEPTNNMGLGQNLVKLDCSSAHSNDNAGYHYHGNMYELADNIYPGISNGDVVPDQPIQIGWAADGYPILYLYGPDVNGQIKKMQPSYELKEGERPGDGETAPCGTYDGRYTRDYEYTAIGDLDECNGVANTVTLTTAIGQETFNYYYVITQDFPQISRCFSGTPHQSFR